VARLSVALDARSLQDQPVGGVGRSTRALVEAVRGDVDLLLLTDAWHPPIDTDLPQRPLRSPFSRTMAAWLQLAVPPALRGFRGIFHCPWYGLPFRQPVPMVVTIHDLTFEHQRSGFRTHQRLAYRVQARWAARTAAHVLTGSETIRRDLCTRYGVDPSRVTVHPDPIDRHMARADLARQRSLRARFGVAGRYVVAIGGAPRRRLDLALASWPLVQSRAPDVTLLVLGRGPAHVPPGVVATGVVDDGDWAAAIGGASALLYPTEFEGFGYPALEAMALGTPVVCAPVGALPEVVGDAGCWFERHDPESIAIAVNRVLTDADLAARLTAAGHARAARATDLGRLRSRVLEAYERAAGLRSGGGEAQHVSIVE
jgi:glycosyltransferase involved in cell wall biosynthesis